MVPSPPHKVVKALPQNYNFPHLKHGHEASLPLPLDVRSSESFQLQGALPPDPLTSGSAPRPRYRLVLCNRHGKGPSIFLSKFTPMILHIYIFGQKVDAVAVWMRQRLLNGDVTSLCLCLSLAKKRLIFRQNWLVGVEDVQ